MSDVRAIPEGFSTITPHIVVKNAGDAIEFYKKAFGAEELGRHPMPDGKIMHATLKIGNSMLMMCDEFEQGCEGFASPQTLNGTPITLHVYTDEVDAAFQKAVDAGCTVRMPVMDTFWGDRYGQVSDPYGHFWSLATHIADLTPEEVAKGAEEFFKNCSEQGHQQ